MKKLFVIGLDCAEPSLVYERWNDDLPNLRRLMEEGGYGRMRSTIPPITVPAWATMVSGKDPGELGFYGFRNRKDYTYDKLFVVNSLNFKAKAIWDYLGEREIKSIALGVPPSYPPKKINGIMISGFLTPSAKSEYAYPAYIKRELEEKFGEYIFDVRNFRTDDKENLLKQLYEMSEQRFEIVKWLMKEKNWDFFMFVDMGIDRLHHGFWKFFDPQHPRYIPGNPLENSGLEYYKFIDRKIGELLAHLSDNTSIIVVSDHGAKRMEGGICINEWLIREGYLKLKSEPQGIVRLEECEIDWKNTMAWASGGYYARVFLNVKGREPEGVISPGDYEKIRDELKEKIESITDDKGNKIETRVYKPDEVYREINNIPPDLIVLFGDLYWRSVGSIGFNSIWTHENDTGPDDANHAQHGIFIYRGELDLKGDLGEIKIEDIKDIMLKHF